MSFEIKPGVEIAFEDKEGLDRINVIRRGIVNGEPMVFDDRTLIPVYVSEGDKCIMVDSRNIHAR